TRNVEAKQIPETIWRDSMLALHEDNRTLAICGQRSILLWDFERGQRIRELNIEPHDVSCMSLSPDGRHIAAGGSAGFAQVWETRSGQIVKRVEPAAWVSPFKNGPSHLQIHATIHSIALT